MNHFRCWAVLLAGMFFLASMCEKLPERQWERGNFVPIGGKPYQLPSGLTVREIKGLGEETTFSLMPLRAVLFNTTSSRVNVRMPAGLVFSPLDLEYQYLMLVQEFAFSVPPDQDTAILLPTFGCNEDLDEPDEEMSYEIHSQVWEREFNELFTILKPKHLDNGDAAELVQDAVYEITDGDGLTDSTRQLLQQLP